MATTHPYPLHRDQQISAFIALDEETIRTAQALRYRVFAEEMGAHLNSDTPGLDHDEIDHYCDHLVVCDINNGRILGYTRLLGDMQAQQLGRYYSESEFNLDKVRQLPGRILEIGRTCVDPNCRGRAIIAILWAALARYALKEGYDYLMGCASISPGPNGYAVREIYRQIKPEQMGSEALAVSPKTPVPEALHCDRDESGIPPLLKAYLRLGAQVYGQPCWDRDFNVMDVFVLLKMEALKGSYKEHFVNKRAARRHANSTTATV